MLKQMRDSFQHLKWILILIIVLFVLFIFVDWGAGGPDTGVVQAYAARVNGETITLRDYQRALYYAEQNYERMYQQPLNDEMRKMLGLPRQVINSLVEQKLLLQEAEKLHLEATPEEVRKKILELPALNPDGKFVGVELYETYVKSRLGYGSAAEFEAELARELTLSKIESAFRSSVVIPDKSAENEYRKKNETAKIRYLLYPAEKAAAEITVSPAEVEAHYKADTSKYQHGEQRQVKYLLADQAKARALTQVTEPELRAAYETQKEGFKTKDSVRAQHILIKVEPPLDDAKAKAKADSIVAQIKAGADFGALAREHSGDPGSATNRGDLGFFERGQMVPEFEQAAFSQPIAEVGAPVKTQFGYHIIRTLDRRPAGYKPFEEVRAELSQRMVEEKAKTEAREGIRWAYTKLTMDKPDSDEDFRALANPKITFNDSPWFGKNDEIPGMGRNAPLTEWAFAAKEGDVSQPIGTSRGPVVAWLRGTRGAGVATLEEVRAKVEADLKMTKARAIARQRLAEASAGGNALEPTGLKLDLSPIEATISREGGISGLTGAIQPLVTAALSANAGEIRGPLLVDQGAILLQVTEVNKFDQQKFLTEKGALVESMKRNELQKLRASVLARIRKDSDVVVNEELVAPPADTAPQGS